MCVGVTENVKNIATLSYSNFTLSYYEQNLI